MFKRLENLLDENQLRELREITETAEFVDGRISNPHSKVKNNLQINDQDAYQRSSQILSSALLADEDFRNFAYPRHMAPPMLSRYKPGMSYGIHPDTALMQIGNVMMRSDLSCTIFLSDPANYGGGALHIQLGDSEVRFKGPVGSAIVYPSTTLHEVEEVESGERIVGLTFIQSYITDPADRELLYELSEVAAIEGSNMTYENFTRLQTVKENLIRRWSTN